MEFTTESVQITDVWFRTEFHKTCRKLDDELSLIRKPRSIQKITLEPPFFNDL
jgi:hypothetical protein